MFEAAELGQSVDEKTWETESARLRTQLLEAQRALAASRRSCVAVVSGPEGVGKHEVLNQILAWMDPRGIRAHALVELGDEEKRYPEFHRYWLRLPAAGRMALFLGGWYSRPLAERTYGGIGNGRFERALDRIVDFERMLANEHVTLVKLWLHLSKKAYRKRLQKLSRNDETAWRVTKREWRNLRHYDDFRDNAEHLIRKTSNAEAPWTIVEATDPHHRALAVARSMLEALGKAEAPPARVRRLTTRAVNGSLLATFDVTRSVSRQKYEKRLPRLQAKVGLLSRKLFVKAKRSLILAFEGPDAAGKGGSIRRVTAAIDAGLYDVTAIAAPTEEEQARPYLWRFWRALPRKGKVHIYDRTWYGRVLVERVEGLARPDEWQRAYGEINCFEEQLVEGGAVLRKFWLAISPDEQLRRFKNRQTTPYKQYKITEEDWRNRAKWDAYQNAADEMFERTSTELAPWTLVAANDKHHARLSVLETVVDALEEAVG